MSVKIRAAFKKDDRHLDGLDAVRQQLIDNPERPVVITGVLEVTNVDHDVLAGQDTPKLRFRAVEVHEGEDAVTIQTVHERRYKGRTNREDMPAETLFEAHERELREAADGEGGAEQDPTAGPWPGDPDYQPPANAEPIEEAEAGDGRPKRTRKTTAKAADDAS